MRGLRLRLWLRLRLRPRLSLLLRSNLMLCPAAAAPAAAAGGIIIPMACGTFEAPACRSACCSTCCDAAPAHEQNEWHVLIEGMRRSCWPPVKGGGHLNSQAEALAPSLSRCESLLEVACCDPHVHEPWRRCVQAACQVGCMPRSRWRPPGPPHPSPPIQWRERLSLLWRNELHRVAAQS